jgi:hypothetical protein
MTQDEVLIAELGEFAYDPYAFVMWAFPWGEAGTELALETGPDEWQTEILKSVRDRLITAEQALLYAVTSGHGVGKSALVAWLVWWSYSTFAGTRGVVTANTENQLKTKTWVEIAKWHRLFIAKHLFKCTATAIFSIDEDQAREWRIDIVPWSERNTEAFAGLHNAGKRIIVIFDEGSAIPDIIYEVTEGATTDLDTEILWFVFGNPTRNTGRFRECFEGGRFAHRWFKLKVDSRSVKRTNKKQLAQWIEDYGLDSDFVRVRILGEFPRTDAISFISRDLAMEATKRELGEDSESGLVLGVDVARFGDDLSVIWPRQGRDASIHQIQFYQGIDTQQLAAIVIRTYHSLGAVAACIDGGGVGGGVVDACRAAGIRVFEVQFGSRPDGFDPTAKYMNKRAEIWGQMRAWLKTGRIPARAADRDLIEELTAPSYTISGKDLIQLESKDMMKRRGVASPDFADALACTFAFPFLEHGTVQTTSFVTDYNPHAEERIHA